MRLGVDLGGTKIEAMVIDEHGDECWRQRVLTPQGDYDATLNAIAQLVRVGKRTLGVCSSAAIGMGTPGAETKDGRMKNCNSTALNGRFLRDDLSHLLGCPVRIANDANCFALAEALSGRGRQVRASKVEVEPGHEHPDTVFGVILGTGVGGGVVVNGKLLTGPNAIVGEWGHNPMPLQSGTLSQDNVDRRVCYCGRVNCVETFLSGPGLAQSYQRRFGEVLAPEGIIEHMREGEGLHKDNAMLIWREYIQQLAVALAQVVNILDPSLIVLGGGLSMIPEIYQDIVSMMRPYVFTDEFTTPVLPALLGDSAGVYGAAWLA